MYAKVRIWTRVADFIRTGSSLISGSKVYPARLGAVPHMKDLAAKFLATVLSKDNLQRSRFRQANLPTQTNDWCVFKY